MQTKKSNGLWAMVRNKEKLIFPHIPVADKNKLLTAVLLGCIGVGFMLWGGSVNRKPATPGPEVPAKAGVLIERVEERWSEARLERETAAVLSRIKGVGQVVVDLQLAGSEETRWLFREEREERMVPQEGGESRETRVLREPVFQRESGGKEIPVRISEKAPVITGVLVVAEGGADPKIQQALGEATATLLGVAIHRVIVLPWGK